MCHGTPVATDEGEKDWTTVRSEFPVCATRWKSVHEDQGEDLRRDKGPHLCCSIWTTSSARLALSDAMRHSETRSVDIGDSCVERSTDLLRWHFLPAVDFAEVDRGGRRSDAGSMSAMIEGSPFCLRKEIRTGNTRRL